MTINTNTLPACPCWFRCGGAADCNICLNPVTGEFEPEAEDDYPPEDAYCGYNCEGFPIGG